MIKMRIPCLVLLSLFLDVGGSERDEQKRRTTVDFENVNFGAKAPIVAMKAMDPLVNGLEDRLTDLFSHAHTEECRAKIAQHMGYFTSALAKEEPMPFFEMSHFDNTCEDEIEWDFDNLPEGVVSRARAKVLFVIPASGSFDDETNEKIRSRFSIWASSKTGLINRREMKLLIFRQPKSYSAMEF